jgi:membrane protein required for colicin V production
MRMISLLTSNMSGMENSASTARGRIDTDDFQDRKPDSFTNTRPCRQAENPSAMNSFDAAVYLGLVVAVATGFNAGLLRSAITILAYLIAMPIAVWATSLVSPGFDGKLGAPVMQDSLLLFGSFLVTGMVLGKLMRMVLDETIGPQAGIGDRLAGAALGAVRVGLVAITLVLIFDSLVSPDRQPAFLAGSQLRPLLSVAGQRGFRSLPPDVAAYIDRLKKDRRI